MRSGGPDARPSHQQCLHAAVKIGAPALAPLLLIVMGNRSVISTIIELIAPSIRSIKFIAFGVLHALVTGCQIEREDAQLL